MALQKQVVPVEIATGIDTKTDPKKVTGRLLSLINAVFQESKALLKRYGFLSLPQTILNGSSIASGVTISPYQNELVVLDGKNLYSFSDQQDEWVNKGTFVTCSLQTTSIVKNSRGQSTQDQASHPSGVQVFTWEDTAGGSYYSVIDTGTGQTLVNSALLSATGFMAKPMVVGNFVVMFYFDIYTQFLVYRAINVATPTSIGSQASVAGTPYVSNAYGNLCAYGVCLINSVLHIVWSSTAGIACFTLNSSLTLTNPRTIGLMSNELLCVFGDSSNNAWIGYYVTGGNLSLTIYSFQFAALVLGPTLIDSSSNFTSLRNLTGIVTGTTGQLFYEVNLFNDFKGGFITTFYGDYIRSNTCSITGTVGTPYNVIRSLGIASKPFIYSGSTYMLSVYDAERTSTTPGLVYDVSTESTYFVIDSLGNIVTKIAQLNGGGISKRFISPEALTLTSTSFQLSYLFKDLLVAENNSVFTQTGVQSAIVDFENVYPSKLQIGTTLLLGGGTFQQYDGSSPTEQNFHLYPELMTAWVGQFGGALSEGQYEYESLYEWTDNQGQTNRSATSDPLIVKTSALVAAFATTSGSTTLTMAVTPGYSAPFSFFNMDNGFTVSGPGIAAGTVVTGRAVTVGPTTYQVTISIAATATAGEVNLTLTPNFTVTGTINDLFNTMTVDPILYIPNSLYSVNSGAQTYASDITYVQPGMTVVQSIAGSGGGQLITSVDQASHLLGGVGGSASNTITETIEIFKTFSGTYTSGSNIITGVTATIFPLLNIGDQLITNAGLTALISSFSASGGTITLNTFSNTFNGTQTANIYFPASVFLKTGQTITGAGIPVDTAITSVAVSGNVTTITLSNKATNTETTQPYVITNTYSANLSIPTLRATNKNNVSIVLYRTLNDETLLYRVSSVSSPTLNNRNDDFAYIADLISDLNLLGNEQLYTTGGEVDNSAPPASSAITTYKNRAILVPNENPLTWWYSKQVIPGSPVEFSENFISNIDSRGGGITAPAAMDDKLILFKENNIFYVVGEGPTPAGTQNDFTEAQLISTDTGCNNPASIVLTPDGLMFQSPKGIYLLARNMSVVYIGDAVEAYNGDTITSANLIENLNQVRFTLSTGVALVYDYYFKQWSVFTNIAAVDSCLYNGIYNYLTSNGLVDTETKGTYTDNGAFIPMQLTTSWMSFAGLQGFQRLWRVIILGKYVSPHTLNVTISTDFTSFHDETVTIPVPSATALYQYRIHIKPQKCQAIQFTIGDTQDSPFGEGLQLSEISLEVGLKAGVNKLSAGRSY